MAGQYDIRRDRAGWTVFDRWTGMTVILDWAEKSGMSYPEAKVLAAALNRRGSAGDRSILQ